MSANKVRRLIGVLLFDAGATVGDLEKIVVPILDQGFNMEIGIRPNDQAVTDWQIIITKDVEEKKGGA